MVGGFGIKIERLDEGQCSFLLLIVSWAQNAGARRGVEAELTGCADFSPLQEVLLDMPNNNPMLHLC